MKDQIGLSAAKQTRLDSEENGSAKEPTRAEEQETVAEPDAPTAAEENVGMGTVLDAEPLSGIQDDASDE
jgi:hypothetical protein